ncbi:MAG: hypothetical protein ACQKBY_01215 [Verrucomicrobiales bacterium]
MDARALFSLLYGFHLVWTGLWRNIAAQAYKPNALWFCLVTGLLVLAGAYLIQVGRLTFARLLSGAVTALVFGFYLYCFISDPSADATYRVGLVIVSSLAHLAILFLPLRPEGR